MKLGNICPAPCFSGAAAFEIPAPGDQRERFRFGNEAGRDFFAVLLTNHPPQDRDKLNPKVAIVGLAPGGTQLDAFIRSYSQRGDYGIASVEGAFAELSTKIITMFTGLGLARKLSLDLSAGTLANHPSIYVTSLVACASLSSAGSSDAFDPRSYAAASRCITSRFVSEMLSPSFSDLRAICILGSHGWKAISSLRCANGDSVLSTLRKAGKLVINIPHPSGQNAEYVDLASLPAAEFPQLEQYVDGRWRSYDMEPPRPGRKKQREVDYRSRRQTYWHTINDLRMAIANLDDL